MSVSKKEKPKKGGGQKCLSFNTRGLLVHKWLLYSTPALETIIANPHGCLLLTFPLQLGFTVLGQGHGEKGATWLTQQLKGSSSTPPPRGDNVGRESRWMHLWQKMGPVFPEGALCRQRETESRNVNCFWYVPFSHGLALISKWLLKSNSAPERRLDCAELKSALISQDYPVSGVPR